MYFFLQLSRVIDYCCIHSHSLQSSCCVPADCEFAIHIFNRVEADVGKFLEWLDATMAQDVMFTYQLLPCNQRIERTENSLKRFLNSFDTSKYLRRPIRNVRPTHFFTILTFENASDAGNYLPPPNRGVFTPHPPKKFSGHPQDQTPNGRYTRPPMGCPLSKYSASVNNHAVDRQLIQLHSVTYLGKYAWI